MKIPHAGLGRRLRKYLITVVFCLFTASAFCQNNLSFSKGIDMLTFFESWQAGSLPNLNKYDETDFAMLKSMGVEIIRLPIHFANLMEPYSTGKVYDIVFEKLDEVCDWAEKYQIYLVIDDHSFNSQEKKIRLMQKHIKNILKLYGLKLPSAIKTGANTSFMKL